MWKKKKGQAPRAPISIYALCCAMSALAEFTLFPLVGDKQNKHVAHAGPCSG